MVAALDEFRDRLKARWHTTKFHRRAHNVGWFYAWKWARWNAMHPVTAGGAGNLCLDPECRCGRPKA